MLLGEDVDVVCVIENVFICNGMDVFSKSCVEKVECIVDGVFVMLSDGWIVEGLYCLMVVGLILNIVGIGFEEVGV